MNHSVVFIDGFLDPEDPSWLTMSDQTWLQAQLPQWPSARIFAYHVGDLDLQTDLVNGIHHAAADFLTESRMLAHGSPWYKCRNTTLDTFESQVQTGRPLIFICKDLGSLVVKQVCDLTTLPAAPDSCDDPKAIILSTLEDEDSMLANRVYGFVRLYLSTMSENKFDHSLRSSSMRPAQARLRTLPDTLSCHRVWTWNVPR